MHNKLTLKNLKIHIHPYHLEPPPIYGNLVLFILFTNPEINLMLKIIIPYPAEVAYQNYSKYYLNLNF